jgi:hypothetical protein
MKCVLCLMTYVSVGGCLEITSVMLCLSGLFGTGHCQMIVIMRMLEAFVMEIGLS